MLLDAMAQGRVQGLICRAPEFYGPGRTQSITNELILESLRARDARELLPRYAVDNLFVSAKFKARFPEFRVTTFEQGLTAFAEGAER